MKLVKYVIIILFVMISCSNKKTTDKVTKISLPEFNPQHILLTDDVFRDPDLLSKFFNSFQPADFIQILEYGDQILINDKYEQWIKIRKDDNFYNNIAWCFLKNVKELKYPIEYRPMNKIKANFAVLSAIEGNNSFKIEGKYGVYSGEYGMNKIYLSFYNRNEDFSDYFQYESYYSPDACRRMELCIDYESKIFPPILSGGRNTRKNTKNNITFIDEFIFCQNEMQNHQIRRIICFTTNNYAFFIDMRIPGSNDNSDLIRKIMKEAPQYFFVYKDGEPSAYNGENPEDIDVLWDYKNDGIEKFAEDLIIGKNPSKTLIQWYDETEKILESLRIE